MSLLEGNAGLVNAGKHGGVGARLRRWLGALAVAPLVLAAPAARATPTNDTISHTTATLTIKSYNVGASAQVFVVLRNPSNGNIVNCINSGHADHWISTGHPRFAQMYSAVQAAALSQRPVIVDFEHISGVCWVKRIQVQF